MEHARSEPVTDHANDLGAADVEKSTQGRQVCGTQSQAGRERGNNTAGQEGTEGQSSGESQGRIIDKGDGEKPG